MNRTQAENEYLKLFGKKLAYIRTLKGFRTRVELAEATGIAESSLCEYENGRQDPTTTTIRKLSDALGVSASVLLCEDEIKNGLKENGKDEVR